MDILSPFGSPVANKNLWYRAYLSNGDMISMNPVIIIINKNCPRTIKTGFLYAFSFHQRCVNFFLASGEKVYSVT